MTGTIPMWTFGERLAKARKTAGYTQEKMAALMGVKAGTLAGWETGAGQPRHLISVVRRWAELTGVDETWILSVGEHAHDGADTRRYWEQPALFEQPDAWADIA